MTIWLPHANFAVCALVMTDDALADGYDSSTEVFDLLYHEQRSDTMWDGHILAVMMYRDCMIREMQRRGATLDVWTLLQNPSGEIYAPPGYSVPDLVGEGSPLHYQHSILMEEHGLLRTAFLPEPSEAILTESGADK